MLALVAAPAAHGQNKPFLVTNDGIGGITAHTACTPKAVSAALGGLPVTPKKIYFDDIAIPVLEVTRDGKRVLLVFKQDPGTRVSRAVALAPESQTSTGVSVGTPMSEVYDRLPNPDCRNGLEQQAGLVFCPAPYLGNVRFAFRCDHPTHDDSLPPPDVLARCPLERIIWLADEY